MTLTKWDARYLELARVVAGWSEDRDRKVGCVITGPDNELRSVGYNGLPRSVDAAVPSRLMRDGGEKYKWVEHAERNAIFAAAKTGIPLSGCTMYLTWFPCEECARAIVQVGISRLVARNVDEGDPTWGARLKTAYEMLNEASVTVDIVD